jgi:hypothetical protein
MASGWYNKGLEELALGDTDLANSDLRAMLLKSTGSFNRDHNFVADVVANEVTAVGYSRQTLTSKVVTKNATADAVYWTADKPVFGPLTVGQTIGYIVVFRHTGDDATAPLLCCWQVVPFGTDGSSYRADWSANGLVKIWSAT